jgi:Reverse transcriptase (RNA-dependent DNA polymerase)
MIVDVFEDSGINEGWMRSNLVLISKVPSPSKPTYFRSLSVCSVYYRLLMKIIANRIKPWLSNLVTHHQSAFLKGMSIQENVLLMQEVMHSFQDTDFKDTTFALKADLFKVFDCVN